MVAHSSFFVLQFDFTVFLFVCLDHIPDQDQDLTVRGTPLIVRHDMQLVENIDEDGEDTYYDALCNALNALISISDLSGDRISDILLKHYVDKVIVRSYGFDFRINLKGDAVEHAASQEVVRKNLPYPQRAALTEQTIETQYQEAFFSILDFETARKFRKSNGNYLRTNQWDDLLVKVYIRK